MVVAVLILPPHHVMLTCSCGERVICPLSMSIREFTVHFRA
jgi:hypothetical protein